MRTSRPTVRRRSAAARVVKRRRGSMKTRARSPVRRKFAIDWALQRPKNVQNPRKVRGRRRFKVLWAWRGATGSEALRGCSARRCDANESTDGAAAKCGGEGGEAEARIDEDTRSLTRPAEIRDRLSPTTTKKRAESAKSTRKTQVQGVVGLARRNGLRGSERLLGAAMRCERVDRRCGGEVRRRGWWGGGADR